MKVKNFEYSVFTDDIDWVKKQKIFNDAKLIHTSSDEPLDVINTFSMLQTILYLQIVLSHVGKLYIAENRLYNHISIPMVYRIKMN